MFGMRLRLLPALRCSVCEQLMDGEKAATDSLIAVLFGAKRYSICPICFQEVHESQWTPNYKRKWTRRVNALRPRSKAVNNAN